MENAASDLSTINPTVEWVLPILPEVPKRVRYFYVHTLSCTIIISFTKSTYLSTFTKSYLLLP